MGTSQFDRRRVLKFLAGSPLLYPAAVAASAWQSGQRLDPIIDAASQALNVFDFEAVARERLPVAHFGYIATGSDDDGTFRANREGFTRFQLRVRRLVDVREIDMSVKLFGGTWSSPIILAPVSSQRAFHADAEIASARAAAAASIRRSSRRSPRRRSKRSTPRAASRSGFSSIRPINGA